MPLFRVGFFIRTLHPDIFGRNFIWKPGEAIAMGTVDFTSWTRRDFKRARLRSSSRGQGSQVAGPAIPIPGAFPSSRSFSAEGVTEYFAMPMLFLDGPAHASSWTTRQPGGFTDEQVARPALDHGAVGAPRRE